MASDSGHQTLQEIQADYAARIAAASCDTDAAALRQELAERESEIMSKSYGREDFEPLVILGQGAFGQVRLVRKVGTSEVFAMKIMKKQAMIEKNQITHLISERGM